MKKVYIETLGCQMNKSDAERMYGMLEHCGYTQTENPKEADMLIINTCSIRQLSEDKAYSAIGVWGKWKKKKPDLKIVFAGCVAQQAGEKLFKRAPYVDLVIGTQRLYELPNLVKRIEAGERVVSTEEKPYEESDIQINRVKSVNAWVPIMEGCNNFCSYCIVPYTRGRERSRKPELILNEVKKALQEGFKEITLLGQNVDSYGKWLAEKTEENPWGYTKDEEGKVINLAWLLRRVNALDGKFRIRFVTSYPTDITEELIDTVIELDKVCEYFHIPMQSGDDYVLKKMNRRYDYATYKRICENIRSRIPDVTITSDFIAGFPGETEEEFKASRDFIDKVDFYETHVFKYSRREGTKAAAMPDQVPEEEKTRRSNILLDLSRKKQAAYEQRLLGTTQEVLIEEEIRRNGEIYQVGHTREYVKIGIRTEEKLANRLVQIEIENPFQIIH